LMLTIAICTYRRFDWLRKCLDALEKQTLSPEEMHLIIVDNSLMLAESTVFRDSLERSENIEYIITPKSGLSYARNIALEKCQTQFIAYLDDDAIASPDWAENLVAAFCRYPLAGVIGGKVSPIWESIPPDWIKGNLLDPLAVLNWSENDIFIDESNWLVGANVAYRTAILRKVGGFDTLLGRKGSLLLAHEELATNNRIRKHGYDAMYVPSVQVDHFIQAERLNIEWFCRNFLWEGASWEIYNHGLKDIDLVSLSQHLEEEYNRLISNLQRPQNDMLDIEGIFKNFRAAGKQICKYFINITNATQPEKKNDFWPVIYIATPCLNAVATIEQTILSIITQAGDFVIRYHIQDGGSTDGTIDLLSRWKERIDKGVFPIQCKNIVFSYKSQPDNGMYNALANAFEIMPSPGHAFMTWINADDILLPGALALIHNISRQFTLEQVSWVSGQIAIFNDNVPVALIDRPTPTVIIKLGLCDGVHWPFIQQEGTFFRSWLWSKVNASQLIRKYRYAGDWNLWRVFAHHAELVQTKWPTGVFNLRDGQLSERCFDKYMAEVNSTITIDNRLESFRKMYRYGVSRKVLEPRYPKGEFDLVAKDSIKAFDYHYNKLFNCQPAKQINEKSSQNKNTHRSCCPPDSGKSPSNVIFVPAKFYAFTYARRSQWLLFEDIDTELYGIKINMDSVDLNVYRNLLIYSFIKHNVSLGSRILEIGVGNSRILKHISQFHECWKIDKFEELGKDSKDLGKSPFRPIKNYMRDNYSEIADNYFDFVFSIPVLGHIPQDDHLCYFDKTLSDINRVLKPGGYCLHLIDVALRNNSLPLNKIANRIFKRVKTVNHFIPIEYIKDDPDIYWMSKEAYDNYWLLVTKKSYEDFGRITSLNILWKKEESKSEETVSLENRPGFAISDQTSEKRIFIVTPCLNAASSIDLTIQSVISQNGDFFIHYHVQDGGSKDGTVKKIKQWNSLLSKKSSLVKCLAVTFTWSSEPDNGMYDAISRGFDAMRIAPDEFMTWINADDVLMPDAISTVFRISSEYPEIQWVGGQTYVIGDCGPILTRDSFTPTKIIREGLCDGHHWYHLQQEGMFFKKVLWFKSKYALQGYRFAGDWNLWRVFAHHSEYYQIVNPLGAFRRRKGQMSIERIADYNAEIDNELPKNMRYQAFCRLNQSSDLYRNRVIWENAAGKFILKKDFEETRKQFEYHWQNVHKQPFGRKVKNILFLGFSVTEQKTGYFDKVKNIFSSKYGNTIEMKCVGLGGLQPEHSRYLFPSIIRESLADIIVLDISTSAFRNYPQLYTIRDHIITLIFLIAISCQQDRAVAIIDLFRNDVDYENDWVSKLHHVVCSKLGVPNLNIAKEIYRNDILQKDFLSDVVHTNPKGSDYYATRISEYLFKLLDKYSGCKHFMKNQTLNLLSTAFDSKPLISLLKNPEQYATYHFQRGGYETTMVEIPEGVSVELELPDIQSICGFSYLMHPLSGYVNYRFDDDFFGTLTTYDSHSYYSRLHASVFTPRKARKIVLSQLEGCPPVKLFKGAENNAKRIGRFGHVFVQQYDEQIMKEFIDEFRIYPCSTV
jgi:GT2 family glycosyltransferase/SAM-dependent methyltransferase